jgi:pimeloyl-ACP methyl ester carboxylesterase
MFTAQMGANLAADFPQGKHLHLDSAGHLAMAEYPTEINCAIAALMTNVPTCQT